MEEFLHHPLSYYGQPVKRLGRGSYGVVDSYDGGVYGKPVAVKRELRFGSDALREMSVYRTVKHPNILEAIDMGVTLTPDPVTKLDTISSYIVFPLAQGTLYKTIKSWSPTPGQARTHVPMETLKRMMYQLVLGLMELHERGHLVHNDLKPQNILIFNDLGKLRPVIADMGFVGRWVCNYPTGYEPRNPRGTLPYRAPELLFDSTVSHPGGDIWALGVIFYEMIFQEMLNPSDTEAESIARIIRRFGDEDLYDDDGITNMMTLLVKRAPNTKHVLKAGIDALKNIKRPSYLAMARKLLDKQDRQVIDLIGEMLAFSPFDRPTSRGVAEHPFFASVASEFPPLPPDVNCDYEPFRRLEELELLAHGPGVGIEETDFKNYVSGADNIQLRFDKERPANKQVPALTWRLYADMYGGMRQQSAEFFHQMCAGCYYIASIVVEELGPKIKNIKKYALKALKLLGFNTYRVSSYDYRVYLPQKNNDIFGPSTNIYLSPYEFMLMTSIIGLTHTSMKIILFQYDVDKYQPRAMPTEQLRQVQDAFIKHRHQIVATLQEESDTDSSDNDMVE